MVRSHRIPFGLKDGQMVGVDAVLSGLACECVCPACHGRLQARKGEIRGHYFAHNQLSDCHSSLETSIHLMAKQIIEEEKRLMLPQLIVSESEMDPWGDRVSESEVVTKTKAQKLTSVTLEQQLTDIRPDVLGFYRGRKILIEICVTHPVEKEKKKKIRERKLSAVEIDLSNVSYSVSKDELRELVVNSVENKKWLSLPSVLEAKQRVRIKLEQKLSAQIREGKRIRKHREFQKRNEPPSIPARSPYRKRVKCESCSHQWRVYKRWVHDQWKYVDVKCPECGSAVSTK